MIIGIDVDLTIVDPIWCEGGWFHHLVQNSHSYDKVTLEKDFNNKQVNYNTCEYFDLKDNFCPYDFWRSKNLYDNIKPYDDAITYINRLIDDGYDVIFVSQIKGDHLKSKTNMLKKYFPNAKGYIYTKEKHFVHTDVMIDDRNKVMNKLQFGTGILFETEYTQCEDLLSDRVMLKTGSWEEIYKIISGRQL